MITNKMQITLKYLAMLTFLIMSTVVRANPALWQATKGDSTIFLFGSIHLGMADFYPLPESVTNGLISSEGLVVEVDLSKADMSEVTALTRRLGMDQKPLSQRLSEKTNVRYQKYCKAKKLPCAQFEQFKPWLLATQLAVFQMMSLGYEAQYGVETVLTAMAKDKGIPLYALESLQEQLEVMAGLTSEEQEQMLLDTLAQPTEVITQLFDAWKSGNSKKMARLLERMKKTSAGARIYSRLITQRNKMMATRLLKLSHQMKTLFVVIGGAHLVSERSVIDELEAAGYRVKRL